MTGGGLDHLLRAPSLLAVMRGEKPGLLILDYDGTLAPFQVRREAAHLYPGARAMLAALPVTGPGRFVIVSGREPEDVARLLDIHPQPEIWGAHGAQRLFPSGELHGIALSPRQQTALQRAATIAAGRGFPPTVLEWKCCSLALHTRGLTPGETAFLSRKAEEEWGGIARESDLSLHSFDGGLELRLPGIDKGRAVRALFAESPECTAAYLGDDETDEDAFAALRPHDLGVLVREQYRPTAAAFWIRPPEELLCFLRAWSDLLTH